MVSSANFTKATSFVLSVPDDANDIGRGCFGFSFLSKLEPSNTRQPAQLMPSAAVIAGLLLAHLKYPFCYTIRRGFDKFFGMIHVLTRHLAPELDHFRFCLGFWSLLHFGRKLDIFGDVLTQGHNWAKMKNEEKSPHVKDGAERG
jgi:hypothetical protein